MSRRPDFENDRRFSRPNDRPDRRGPYRHEERDDEGEEGAHNADGPSEGGYWLFGIHAVRDALVNPARVKRRLILTRNAALRLEEALAVAKIDPEISDPRRFAAPLDPQSVHQGAALLTDPLDWGGLKICEPRGRDDNPRVLVLDRVTDPHNVGAILRSSEVFGARAVIAPWRHSATEGGALAKAASGALERQPYVRIGNLARALSDLRDMGYALVGLDGEAPQTLAETLPAHKKRPLALVLGAEGPGLRHLTKETCDSLARIPGAADFASLNVSNAAAVALYAASV